jgi:hypothetical protein
LKFTSEPEVNNNINYLNLPISRTEFDITFRIYRKPAFSDTIIPYDSCHPFPHKYAAIRFLYNRLHNYDLDEIASSKELNTIHNILHNNGFPIKIYNFNHKKPKPTNTDTQKQKWISFTYIGKETRYITHIFKNTNVKIAYTTKNSLDTHLSTKEHRPDKYSASGIYKLSCPDCNKAYIGQTGRALNTCRTLTQQSTTEHILHSSQRRNT